MKNKFLILLAIGAISLATFLGCTNPAGSERDPNDQLPGNGYDNGDNGQDNGDNGYDNGGDDNGYDDNGDDNGEPVDPVPVERTVAFEMRDGLIFDIVFTGLENADLPEYVEDLKLRLTAVNTSAPAQIVVTNLISQGNRFTIEIVYEEGQVFTWDAGNEPRVFRVSADSIPAVGPAGIVAIRDAFGEAATDLLFNPPAVARLDEATMRQIELAVRLEIDRKRWGVSHQNCLV